MIIKNIPFLKITCSDWNFQESTNLDDLLTIINEQLYKHNGIGLSAIQIGVAAKVFIIRTSDGYKEFINPKIVGTSDKKIKLDEGSISFPDVVIPIKRAESIRIRYQTKQGDTQTDRYDGLTARIIQQQVDHCNSILFFDRANKYHRDKVTKLYYKENKL